MGVLAALRSLCTKRATGLMITASHNPVHENGVKLADPSGGMLNVAWEPYSDMLANAPDVENFLQVLACLWQLMALSASWIQGSGF
jgi:phosphoacetylglucosamine mutase